MWLKNLKWCSFSTTRCSNSIICKYGLSLSYEHLLISSLWLHQAYHGAVKHFALQLRWKKYQLSPTVSHALRSDDESQVERQLLTAKPTWTELLETLRFGDENDYEYEIWFKVFSRTVKKIYAPEVFIVPFFTREVSNVIVIEGG